MNPGSRPALTLSLQFTRAGDLAAHRAALPRHRVQDIDTPEDWERAEWLFKAMQTQAAQA